MFLEFQKWNEQYKTILDIFNYDPLKDQKSCQILSSRLGRPPELAILDKFRGRECVVIGNAPGMQEAVDSLPEGFTIVAGSAIKGYHSRRGIPDILVTDLDHDRELTEICMNSGSIVFIHAHGDNIDLISSFPINPEKNVIGTCQCRPETNTFNFGGFTDGDRGVFVADYLNSPKISLVGFDFNDVREGSIEKRNTKKKKLKVAENLIDNLKSLRTERYGTDNIVIL